MIGSEWADSSRIGCPESPFDPTAKADEGWGSDYLVTVTESDRFRAANLIRSEAVVKFSSFRRLECRLLLHSYPW